ncbi:M20/M25/M40 family metallo-hydrolase [Erysipelothrix sp. HDW6C]|uniref:M20/M25/M40 family metallo-hydrolase n=1 Tax=Erysipelothrix sp. HDW6C TaxID=2714930 RepID=UPI00140A3C26|nr:M20/M25/M40 family metallo-hydrolase [Erysipelothrix sp. HDW6C]QIK70619.1 M20/M25/M40 family metallo-hydrolase [Erysipelothrix sp. HDW6C]
MESRLVRTFMDLVIIDSESGNEGLFHRYLIERFTSLGLNYMEDDSMGATGLGGNNLLFTLPGNVDGTPIFFSAHTDTVSPGVGIVPKVKDGIVYSDGPTILAADDKAGIAIMLELIERLVENNAAHTTIEFILTPGEEIGLIGAAAFDSNLLQAKHGFVLDNGGPVGSITLASPTLASIDVHIKGKTAHAGLEPEKGISAITVAATAISRMKLGRVSDYTTANIGTITGGAATNIVAEEVFIKAEARSIERSQFDAQIQHMNDVFEAVAHEFGAEVSFAYDIKSVGYYFDRETPIVAKASAAIRDLEIDPRFEVSGGGSDANIFNARGKEVVNLSIGYENIHTIDEYIPVAELHKAVELCYQLVKNAMDYAS